MSRHDGVNSDIVRGNSIILQYFLFRLFVSSIIVTLYFVWIQLTHMWVLGDMYNHQQWHIHTSAHISTRTNTHTHSRKSDSGSDSDSTVRYDGAPELVVWRGPQQSQCRTSTHPCPPMWSIVVIVIVIVISIIGIECILSCQLNLCKAFTVTVSITIGGRGGGRGGCKCAPVGNWS